MSKTKEVVRIEESIGTYMAFVNKGEVPLDAFKLLGASNKRDDENKIGFFGTGLKYGIAVLLRNRIDFRVFIGTKEVEVTTVPVDFLGTKMEVIVIDGERTSMTTETGINWEPWFAIRELLANCLDEGGNATIEDVSPQKGYTKIYVDMDERLGDVFSNWSKYFSDKRPVLFADTRGKILEKLDGSQELLVYRRGIKVYSDKLLSLFDYDAKDIAINESRVAEKSWEVNWECSKLLAQAGYDIIKKFTEVSLRNQEHYIEWNGSFWTYADRFSKDWLDVIDGRTLIPAEFAGRFTGIPNTMILPNALIKNLEAYFGNKVDVVGGSKGYELTDQSGMEIIKQSLERLASIGFPYHQEVHIVKFTSQTTLGMYDAGHIYIDQQVLGMEELLLDRVMLEEIIHHDTGFEDFSRDMQNKLFEMILLQAIDLKSFLQ